MMASASTYLCGKIHDAIEQGTDEWRALRLGKLTASRIADATATLKSGGWGASRDAYMAEIISERLTGVPAEQFVSAAMKAGTEKQPDAKAAYEFFVGGDLTSVAFVDHPTINMSGASPDDLVGKAGLVEYKCPLTHTHIGTLLSGSIDGGYVKQMQWQMACTGRKWCDWVSYNPKLPERMRLFVKRVVRDDDVIARLEADAILFLNDVDQKIAALLKQYGGSLAA